MWIFTVTAGRTGSAWLAKFIAENMGIPSVHEHLGIDDFGVRTPDIRTMRNFNELGMTPVVQDFWKTKIHSIENNKDYAETNHAFCKCGIVEYLADQKIDNDICFLNLRRNWVETICSYIQRNDFSNYTVIWQWYLDYKYKNRIVDPTPLLQIKGLGQMLWYIAEIETRQEYYKILYGDRFRFLDIELEEIVTREGAEMLLLALGSSGEPIIPEARNTSRAQAPSHIRDAVSRTVSRIKLNPRQLAATYIDKGSRLA